jgi:hypothetical protein
LRGSQALIPTDAGNNGEQVLRLGLDEKLWSCLEKFHRWIIPLQRTMKFSRIALKANFIQPKKSILQCSITDIYIFCSNQIPVPTKSPLADASS